MSFSLQKYLQQVYTYFEQDHIEHAREILDLLINKYPEKVNWEVLHLRGVSHWLVENLIFTRPARPGRPVV